MTIARKIPQRYLYNISSLLEIQLNNCCGTVGMIIIFKLPTLLSISTPVDFPRILKSILEIHLGLSSDRILPIYSHLEYPMDFLAL